MSAAIQAQSIIQILNADELQGIETDTAKVKHLIGNVRFKQDEMYLNCDRADFFDSENRVEASGHIHIIQADSIHIYGDVLLYDGNTRIAILKQNVKLTEGKMILQTPQLTYNLNEHNGYYDKGGVLTDDSSTLKSSRGFYNANTGDVYFKKDVTLTNPSYHLNADTLKFNVNSRTAFFLGPTNIVSDTSIIYCEGGFYNTVNDDAMFTNKASLHSPPHFLTGDTLYYNKKDGTGLALKNVFWNDTSRNLMIRGNYIRYDEKNENILATKNSVLISVISNDSMFLAADTLQSFLSADSSRIIVAYHHVKIFKSDLQAVCDSLSYSDADSTFRFHNHPLLWVDGNQLSADSISLQMKNNHPYLMKMNHCSLIVDEVRRGYYNQVQGKNMTGYFLNDELHELIVDGNGESIYYAGDDSSGYFGMNKAACSNMHIIISNKKIDHIDFLTKPDATLYPIKQLPPEEMKLKNFKWMEDFRPKSEQELF